MILRSFVAYRSSAAQFAFGATTVVVGQPLGTVDLTTAGLLTGTYRHREDPDTGPNEAAFNLPVRCSSLETRGACGLLPWRHTPAASWRADALRAIRCIREQLSSDTGSTGWSFRI